MIEVEGGVAAMSAGPGCPLCDGCETALYYTATDSVPWHSYSALSPRERGLRFYACPRCFLVFKDPAVRCTPEQERRRYAKHRNDISDKGYREHLMKVVRPLMDLVPRNARGLDYGCGPSVSAELLARDFGRECCSYDPYFFPDEAVLQEGSYDFVTCSEVVEHFQDPRGEFETLRSLLTPGGVVAIMTQLVPERFDEWWYHRDPTHIVFYSPATMEWIGTYAGFRLLKRETSMVFLQKL